MVDSTRQISIARPIQFEFPKALREHGSNLVQFAPRIVSLALVAVIAWLLAETTLALLAPSNSTAGARTEASVRVRDPGGLAKAGLLFGEWAPESQSQAALDTEQLAETKLPLSLIGVFVSGDKLDSGAIIASGQGAGKHYEVGERIPGNAILESVQVNSVMIRRGAQLERLSFPKDTSGNALLSESTDAPPDRRKDIPSPAEQEPGLAAISPAASDTSDIDDRIEKYRTLAHEDPHEALNLLGLKPFASDGTQGYRVASIPDNEWVQQSGLQDGDILLSVNGQRVGNPDIDRLEIDNLITEGQVRLEIQRGERRFYVSTKVSP